MGEPDSGTPAEPAEQAGGSAGGDLAAVEPAENAYAAAFEQARQIATSFREQTAQQQGNAVG